jgi:hypothetical protein
MYLLTKNKIILFFLISIVFVSCKHITKKAFLCGTTNPTEYYFNASMEELKQKIIQDFESQENININDIYCRKMTVYTKQNHTSFNSIFENLINRNDIVLCDEYSEPFYIYSDVYYIANRPLLYNVGGFHLHIDSIDSNLTKIRVIVLDPKVVIGNQLFCIPSHCGYRYKKVEPTTIEEYKILYRIGKSIGQKMPQIILPLDKY